MTKEEKIKEAWGYAWDFIDGHVKENALHCGWVHKLNINIHFNELNIELQQHYTDKWLYRPKSLQGIENNNGWIKIESEEDLPKDENIVEFWVYDDKEIVLAKFMYESKRWYHDVNLNLRLFPTHYQPIEKPKPPIY